jgi:hypothetical protein
MTEPTDAEMLALIEKHLGLKPRRDDTVIDPRTGRFHDVQRYRDFAREIRMWNPHCDLPGAWDASDISGGATDCTPQPPQAQAGAVPLTNARLQDISLDYSDSEDECTGFRDGWRAAEKHFGIKGGQHGL